MTVSSPAATRIGFLDVVPRSYAYVGMVTGTTTCGIDGGSWHRNPLITHFMGRRYSPMFSTTGLGCPTNLQVWVMAESASVMVGAQT